MVRPKSDPAYLDLAGLPDIIGPCTIVEVDAGYHVYWHNGDFFSIFRVGDVLWFSDLVSYSGDNRLTQLCSCLPGYFRGRGIKTFRASAGGDLIPMYLRKGFVLHEDGGLTHDISPGCRMDEFAAWRRGEAPRPAWRADPHD
jgi:hypothetical protein